MTQNQLSPTADLKGYILRYETIKGRTGWKQRWAVLCDFCLYLYRDPSDKECFYALLLPSSKVTQSFDESGKFRNSIKIEEPNQPAVYLSADTDIEFQMWYDALACSALLKKPHQVLQMTASNAGYISERSQSKTRHSTGVKNAGQTSYSIHQPSVEINGDEMNGHHHHTTVTTIVKEETHCMDPQVHHQQMVQSSGGEGVMNGRVDDEFVSNYHRTSQQLQQEPQLYRGSQPVLHTTDGAAYRQQQVRVDSRSQPALNDGSITREHRMTQQTMHGDARNSQPTLNDGSITREHWTTQQTMHGDARNSQPTLDDGSITREHWTTQQTMYGDARNSQPTLNDGSITREHRMTQQTMYGDSRNSQQSLNRYNHQNVESSQQQLRSSQPTLTNHSGSEQYDMRNSRSSLQQVQQRQLEHVTTTSVQQQSRPDTLRIQEQRYVSREQPASSSQQSLNRMEHANKYKLASDFRTSQQSVRSGQERANLSGSAHSLKEEGSYRVARIQPDEYSRRNIETVREDPHMADSHVIETAPLDEIKRKYPVTGLAKRMSIAASDLLGKSHDELLILLIQLNREKASLERRRDYYYALLHRQPHMEAANKLRAELRDVELQIDLSQPLVNFIDNIVSLGALYNGDDIMFASEYRQHLLTPEQIIPVKDNLQFLRKQQEREFNKQWSGGDNVDGTTGNSLRRSDFLNESDVSVEFTKTRKQLEEELNQLEQVYTDYHKKKSSLGTFMTDISKFGLHSSTTDDHIHAAKGSSLLRPSHQSQITNRTGSSSVYLETDLDNGRTVDLAAKFPRRSGYYSTMRASAVTSQRQYDPMTLDSRLRSNADYENLPRMQLQPPSVSDEVFVNHRDEGGSKAIAEVHRATPMQSTLRRSPSPDNQRVHNTATTVTTTTLRQDTDHGAYSIRRAPSPRPSQTEPSHFPDPDEFLIAKNRNLPMGAPAPEKYQSQPHLASKYSDSEAASRFQPVSVQEQLDSLLEDMGHRPQSNSRLTYTATATTDKPLVKMDPSRYKRSGTNYSGDQRNAALDDLAKFADDIKGVDHRTYYRAETTGVVHQHNQQLHSSAGNVNYDEDCVISVNKSESYHRALDDSIPCCDWSPDDDLQLHDDSISPEERKQRLRRLIANYSMQEYSTNDLGGLSLEQERARREQVLYEREILGDAASRAAVTTGYLR